MVNFGLGCDAPASTW
ncbi:unnamed protein product, partial [Adineta steineri]